MGRSGHPCTNPDYREFTVPALALPFDDAAWGNRIVWICARILQWAQTEARLPSEWQSLKDTVDEWERMRPSSFNAFFYQEANKSEGGHFPELWFPDVCHGELNALFNVVLSNDYAADAHQHLNICRIVLAMNRPDSMDNEMLAIGPTKALEITMLLKEIVAVARCNPHAGTTPYLAANAVHNFAINVRDAHDRVAIMEYLEEAENGSGWPTDATRQLLRAHWTWPRQDNAEHSNQEYL